MDYNIKGLLIPRGGNYGRQARSKAHSNQVCIKKKSIDKVEEITKRGGKYPGSQKGWHTE